MFFPRRTSNIHLTNWNHPSCNNKPPCFTMVKSPWFTCFQNAGGPSTSKTFGLGSGTWTRALGSFKWTRVVERCERVLDKEVPGDSSRDLFGMVKWPFGNVKWPPTIGDEKGTAWITWLIAVFSREFCVAYFFWLKPWKIWRLGGFEPG